MARCSTARRPDQRPESITSVGLSRCTGVARRARASSRSCRASPPRRHRGGPTRGPLGNCGTKTRAIGVRRIWTEEPILLTFTEAHVNRHHDNGTPGLPAGRYVWLPGSGRTFVRELAGPPGAPAVVLL